MVRYGWQQPDVASRADIRVAIENAEALLCTICALRRGATLRRQGNRRVARATWTQASLADRDVDPTPLSQRAARGADWAIGVEARPRWRWRYYPQ